MILHILLDLVKLQGNDHLKRADQYASVYSLEYGCSLGPVSPHLQALLSLEHLFPVNLDIQESNLLENLVSGNSRFISSLNSGPTSMFNETRV